MKYLLNIIAIFLSVQAAFASMNDSTREQNFSASVSVEEVEEMIFEDESTRAHYQFFDADGNLLANIPFSSLKGEKKLIVNQSTFVTRVGETYIYLVADDANQALEDFFSENAVDL